MIGGVKFLSFECVNSHERTTPAPTARASQPLTARHTSCTLDSHFAHTAHTTKYDGHRLSNCRVKVGLGSVSDFCWRAGNRALGFAALLVGGAVVEDAGDERIEHAQVVAVAVECSGGGEVGGAEGGE